MKTRRLIKDNSKEVLKLLLKRINCNYSDEIYTEMKDHPDFPSFLSFHHILKKKGVDSIALETNKNDLRFNLPKPILVHITSNEGMFLLLEKIDDQFAFIINEKNELEKQPIEDFLDIWDGYALIIDIENIKEPKATLIDKIKYFLNYYSKPFCIATFLILFIYSLISFGQRNLFNLLYLLEFGSGIVFSVLLLIEHFDKNNLFIRNICFSKNNKKINCSSILNSKDAYFIGIFSWSDIGFIYFVILFFLSLFFPVKLSLSFSVLTSVFIFPYVFYSLYYQKFIAKNWCVLCLCVQGVIISVFITSIFALKNAKFEYLFFLENIILLAIFSLTIIAIYVILKPLIYSHVNLPVISNNFKTIKHNNDVKSILFGHQITYSFNDIEKINIGNPNGNDCITVIFSPICEPCMLELTKLIPL
ncbi:MAG: vitamin K epoxide reductase family protein [Bacteroidales bacterium]